ncbi:MAG: hypothetical protein ACI9LA_002312, partial [Bacteroidia bacterium]
CQRTVFWLRFYAGICSSRPARPFMIIIGFRSI